MRVWEIPVLIVFVLHQHNSARKVFDELLLQSFLFFVDFARFFLGSLLSSKSCFRAAF